MWRAPPVSGRPVRFYRQRHAGQRGASHICSATYVTPGKPYFDLRAGKAEATVEAPHPRRDSAAAIPDSRPQFGHSGMLPTLETTAATVRLNVGRSGLGPASAVPNIVTLCNHLNRGSRLVQRSMSAWDERGHREDHLRFHWGDHGAVRVSVRCLRHRHRCRRAPTRLVESPLARSGSCATACICSSSPAGHPAQRQTP